MVTAKTLKYLAAQPFADMKRLAPEARFRLSLGEVQPSAVIRFLAEYCFSTVCNLDRRASSNRLSPDLVDPTGIR